MFSIRVEHKSQQPSRELLQAMRYMVFEEEDGGVRLSFVEQGSEEAKDVKLTLGDVAYAMNEKGVTVDVIRTFPR